LFTTSLDINWHQEDYAIGWQPWTPSNKNSALSIRDKI
jgi:hypothetical protein